MMTAVDHLPALVLGRRSEILACNALLRAVLGAEVDAGVVRVRWLFLDPRARQRIATWADYAAPAVGARLIFLEPDVHDELRAAGPEFSAWWDDHGVTDRTSVDKRIAHPVVGGLSFGIEALVSPHDVEQRLITYTVEPGSLTARTLPVLASWGLDAPAPSTRD